MTSVDLALVRAQVELLRWSKQRQAELKALETKARDTVEAAMGEADEGTLDGKPVIHWRRHKRRSLDQGSLKEARPEVYEEHVKMTEVRRFEIVEEE